MICFKILVCNKIKQFWLFLCLRGLMGIGQASFSCVAPTIIGDTLDAKVRITALSLYFMAIPIGSGMGFILGSNIANNFGNWQQALRFTSPICISCIVLLVIFLDEPKRDGQTKSPEQHQDTSGSVWKDVGYLLRKYGGFQ